MGENVLITGASTGIGKAIAAKYLENGFNVIINYAHDDDLASETFAELVQKYDASGRLFCIKADVSDSKQVERLFYEAREVFGEIQVLINNAGIAQDKLFTDITDDDWNEMIGTNLTGCFNCCREAIPYMVRVKYGRIVNVSSMWGIVGASMEVHYSAAKAGVIGLTKALAKELGPSGITVNCVAPGAIDTRMNACYSEDEIAAICDETPLGRLGKPSEIADAVYFLTSSDFTTGQVLSPNGGLVI
ncbi:MAG: SDR family oxidoreductase [Clostridia bacterium]|nr:SDR family oxidoreductase [Clostridia bacterium]